MALGSADAAEARSFGIGTVLSAGLGAVGRNIVPFVVSAFAIGVTERVFSAWLAAHPIHAASMIVRAGESVLYFLILLVSLTLLQAVIAYGTLQHLRARKASIRGSFEGGFSAMPQLLPAVLMITSPYWFMIVLIMCIGHPIFWLEYLASGLSMFFLLIGLWMVAPIAVSEPAGAIGIFGRGWTLSADHRWKALGIPLLTLLAILIGLAIIFAETFQYGLIGDIVANVLFWAFVMIGSALSATSYHCLRIEKEGAPVAEIANVFD